MYLRDQGLPVVKKVLKFLTTINDNPEAGC